MSLSLTTVTTSAYVSPSFRDIKSPFEIVANNKRYDDYGDDDFYNERREDYARDEKRKVPSYRPSQSNEPSFLSIFQNQRQLGATLVGIGVVLTFLGMMLLFERNLLRLGNISLIAGVFLLIGPTRVTGFFLKESRVQATVITSLGIILVFWGKPRLGIILEVFGLLNLFGNMFPLLLAVGKNIPIVGDLLSAFEGGDKKQDRRRRGDDDYEPRRYSSDSVETKRGAYPEF